MSILTKLFEQLSLGPEKRLQCKTGMPPVNTARPVAYQVMASYPG